MMWNSQFETMPRAVLEALQVDRLREAVQRVAAAVPFYKRLGESADSIRTLDDLARLPFTEKDDLRQSYPFGLFAVPRDEVVRIHASSGTTGTPIVAGYTRSDLDVWGEVMARTLVAAGVTERDTIHNAFGYGLFTGGLGVHIGAERLGATVVPVSGGMTRRQLMLLEDFQATVITATPSYALVIAEQAAELGIDFRSVMKLRVGIFGAEPWSERMRTEIESKMGLEAFDIYGLTEIIGPGVAIECGEHAGLHIFEDHFLAEIIDPETGRRLPAGEPGELVITTLTKRATPLIRYRTRDRTSLRIEPCPCGRTLARMDRVVGRTDDMLIVRGVNVFPQAIERVLLGIDGLESQYEIVIDRPRNQLDVLEVRVEVAAGRFDADHAGQLESLRNEVERSLLETLGVSSQVKLLAPRTLERSQGKARRVVDKRAM